MSDMKNISPVPAGYLVRKTVNGSLHQRFFGTTTLGSEEAALKAAIDFRDELIRKIPVKASFQKHNINNNTGVVGVAWHCRPNSHREGNVVHCFRGQMPKIDSEGPVSKAWSVQRLSLWGAYQQAVDWRITHMEGKAPEASYVEDKFITVFFPYFAMCVRKELDSIVKEEMINSLANLKSHPATPERIRAAANEALNRVSAETKGFLKVISSNDRVEKVPSLLDLAKAASHEQAI